MRLTLKKRTAAELLAELEADPEWRQRRDERARAVAEAQGMLREAEQPVIRALGAAGAHVTQFGTL